MKKKATRKKKASASGSTFDSFLEQEGIRDEVDVVAMKRVQDWKRKLTERSKRAKRSKPKK